jgi:hypothetical protein
LSRNSGGTYSRLTPPGPGGYVGGVGNKIYASNINGEYNDIGAEITDSVNRSGKGAALANLPMGGFKHTGAANGVDSTDYATIAQMIPAGTAMTFYQAAAPTGWVQVTTLANHMMRIVSGAGGGSFTGDSPILNNKITSHTHVWTGNAVADHVHGVATTGTATAGGGGVLVNGGTSGWNSGLGGGHTPTGTNAAPAGASNWTPSYCNMILCTKNAYS